MPYHSSYTGGDPQAYIEQTYGSPTNAKAARLQYAMIPYVEATTNPWKTIPPGVTLKVGDRGHYVLVLRDRLLKTNDLSEFNNSGSDLYDHNLKLAVENFQRRHHLKVDGAVGEQTRVALNVPPQIRLNQLAKNLARVSSIPNEERLIFINTASYQLEVLEQGSPVLDMRVIVGRPDQQTPEIYSRVGTVVFNPRWNIPNSIATKEIIPKIIHNPNYLLENNIEILENWSKNARVIPPDEISWANVSPATFPYRFRQRSGDSNALGRIKFLFPNSHDVYMHDTPAKSLFSARQRNFSHGCIRLENPYQLAEYLLRNDSRWNHMWLNELIVSEGTTRVSLEKSVPVYITYITAWVDRYGQVHFREDVYQRDSRFL